MGRGGASAGGDAGSPVPLLRARGPMGGFAHKVRRDGSMRITPICCLQTWPDTVLLPTDIECHEQRQGVLGNPEVPQRRARHRCPQQARAGQRRCQQPANSQGHH